MKSFYCAGLIIEGDEKLYYTPRWSDNPNSGRAIIGCVTRDGKEHTFDEPKNVVEARDYQAANGGLWI